MRARFYALVLLLCVGTCSCSLTISPSSCRASWSLPAIDMAASGALSLGVVAIATAGDPNDAEVETEFTWQAQVAAGVGGCVAFLASAIAGFAMASECEQRQREQWLEDVEQRRLSGSQAKKPSPSRAKPAKSARRLPPDGIAGFHLGWERAEARERCEEAGHTMTQIQEAEVCSGIPDEPRRRGHVELRFCEDRLCQIETRYVVPSEDGAAWERAFKRLRRWLKRRYGAPAASESRLPGECSAASVLPLCLRDGRAEGRARWTLAYSRHVELFMPARFDDGSIGIGVRYGLPEGAELVQPEPQP